MYQFPSSVDDVQHSSLLRILAWFFALVQLVAVVVFGLFFWRVGGQRDEDPVVAEC